MHGCTSSSMKSFSTEVIGQAGDHMTCIAPKQKGNSSSSLGESEGCWHSKPYCQPPLKEDLHLHHIRHMKRLNVVSGERLSISYSIIPARNGLKVCSYNSLLILLPIHTSTHSNILVIKVKQFLTWLLAFSGFVVKKWLRSGQRY